MKMCQRVGDCVHVPPGWLHAVFTEQATVKMAWDYLVPETLASYMASWMHVATKVKKNAQDYMAVPYIVSKFALESRE
eukprot:scaffold72190_cov32-Tisochrysis_lutea.AAC.1